LKRTEGKRPACRYACVGQQDSEGVNMEFGLEVSQVASTENRTEDRAKVGHKS
jgi:hypothetical protein